MILFIMSLLMSVIAEEYYPFTDLDYKSDLLVTRGGHQIVRETGGSITFYADKLIIHCYKPLEVNKLFHPLHEMVEPKEVWFYNCKLPPKPLVALFKEFNINGSIIDLLGLKFGDLNVLDEGNYTKGLNITRLYIDKDFKKTSKDDFLKLNQNLLEPLTSLTSLSVGSMMLPPLPKETRLQNLLILNTNSINPMSTWMRYCRDLRELSFKYLFAETVPVIWPRNCSQLKTLTLNELPKESTNTILSSGIEASCKNLQALRIFDSDLSYLPTQLLARDLQYIQIIYNKLQDRDILMFPKLLKLTHLDLSNNLLIGETILNIGDKMPALRYLYLDGNENLDFCSFENQVKTFASQMTSLVHFSIRGTWMKPHCLRAAEFSKLENLDLAESSSDVFILMLEHFPRTNATRLTVDLRRVSVRYIVYVNGDVTNINLETDDDFHHVYNFSLNHKLPLTVLLDAIDCDCVHYELAKYLRASSDELLFPGLTCKNSKARIIDEPLYNMNCVKEENPECTVRRYEGTTTKIECTKDTKTFSKCDQLNNSVTGVSLRSRNNESVGKTVRLDCHSGVLTEGLPSLSFITHHYNYQVNVSDNRLETVKNLKSNDMIQTIQWIDLRRNEISYLDEDDMEWLFRDPQRQVWLHQNNFLCTCDKSSMIEELYKHRDQIIDYNDIKCYNTGQPLRLVSTFLLCQYGNRIFIAAGLTMTIIIICFVFLLWHYKLQVKIYLYYRGWCLFWLNEDDVDSERPYDVFLSFAHEDERYVVEELLPKLENEPYYYRVCVHYRDWVVGEGIPAQIMRSVANSKRTVILLSRNFVKSIWSTLEFRYALANTNKEGRVRLIVVVLDDVLSEPLEPELQIYLSFNTYLHGSDPRFWEKLSYAMPRRKTIHEPALDISPQEQVLMADILQGFSPVQQE